MTIKFSSGMLDGFATKLSEFTSPNIPKLELSSIEPMLRIVMASKFGILSNKKARPIIRTVANVTRRACVAVDAYQRGREEAYAYVNGDRYSNIVPYFLALSSFETAVSCSYQAAEILRMEFGVKHHQKNDGSVWDRLRCIYNGGIKHSHGKYEEYDDEGEGHLLTEVSTPVWLTNEGIECFDLVGDLSKGVHGLALARVTYVELVEAISDVRRTFHELQKEISKRFPVK